MLTRLLSTVAKKQIISVTPSAWQKLNNISNNSGNPNFLFSANGGGCNGFKYILEQTDVSEIEGCSLVENPDSQTAELTAVIAIEPVSEFLLIGTKIDYVSDDFDNKFVYAPDKNLATSCGCGVSFSPTETSAPPKNSKITKKLQKK